MKEDNMENNKAESGKKSGGLFKIIRPVIIVILIGIIVYEAIGLYNDQHEYKVAGDEYSELSDQNVIMPNEPDVSAADEDYPALVVDSDALLETNEDYIGWLYFPALNISYPIVQEQSVNEYIDKTFDGVSNKSGCIFMDNVSSPSFDGYSDFIFGHNMKNGTMFGSLKKLYKNSDERVLDANPYVYVYTSDKVYKFEVFAYYMTTGGSDVYDQISTDDEYDSFVTKIKSRTNYTIPDDVSFDERPEIFTLSTCSGSAGGTKRFVVHTVQIAQFDITKE